MEELENRMVIDSQWEWKEERNCEEEQDGELI